MQRNSAGVGVEPWQQAKTQQQEERRAVRHCLHVTPVVRTYGMGLVVRDAVQLVLMDKGFKIPSSSAKTAVETAEKLLEWCSQAKNKEVFGQFATDLLQELHG